MKVGDKRVVSRWLVILCIFLISCGEEDSPVSPEIVVDVKVSLTGVWEAQNLGLKVRLSLTQTEDKITGAGRISDAVQSDTLIVVGGITDSTVWMRFSLERYLPINFTGNFANDEIGGVFNGSGFVDFPMNFKRQ